ncbi:MAG: hypothetical protein MK010_04705 [Erythrobacter sp.]|nr:hypothetical protein [Erythrobacter sp.]
MTVEALAKRTGLSSTTIKSVELGGGAIASILKISPTSAPKAKRRAPERAYWVPEDKDDRDSCFTPPGFIESIYASSEKSTSTPSRAHPVPSLPPKKISSQTETMDCEMGLTS